MTVVRTSEEGIEWLDWVDSTNAEVVRRVRDGRAAAGSALATLDQRSGRGRLGRTWQAPAGRTLALTVVLEVAAVGNALGWIPLIAGRVVADAVARRLPATAAVGVKWPNDVLVGGRKIAGILAELIDARSSSAVVAVGMGINLALTPEELPVPTATSLLIEGGAEGLGPVPDVARDVAHEVRAELVREVAALVADPIPGRSLVAETVRRRCATLGAPVRVELPGGESLVGRATILDDDGRLGVTDEFGRVQWVGAGDVTHLRYE